MWRRAGFTSALVLAMAACSSLQFAIGALAPFLTDDLGLTRSQIGGLTAVLYLVAGVASPAGGRLVRSVDARHLLLALYVIASAAYLSVAIVPGPAALLVGVAIVGVATAVSNPVTNHLISAHVPAGTRGMTMGLKQSGIQLGAVLAGGLLPAIALAYGWRAALLSCLVITAVGAGFTHSTVPATPGRAPAPKGASQPSPAAMAFGGRLALYAFLMGAGAAAINAYLALYAFESLAFGRRAAGAAVAAMGGVGLIGRVAWAKAADSAVRTETALRAMAVVAAVSVFAVLGARAVPPALWLAAVGLGASAGAWNSVAMLAIVNHTDLEDTGPVSGIVLRAFFAGFVLSPVLFGLLVDATSNYVAGWLAVGLVFASAASVPLRSPHQAAA